MSRTEPSELAERGRRVLVLEADAIRRGAERLGPAFSAAGRLLAKATGRLIGSDVVLDASVTEEACPETLAPTTSTTAALALGDALAVTLLEVKGFRREQFAALHPGGTLGRHLLLRVADVMLAGNVPALGPDRPMRECVVLLAEKRGTVAVVDAAGSLVGVVTAGDLTRLMERTDQFLDIPVRDVMTRTPKSTTADELAGAAVRLMEQHGIMALPVLDGGRRVVGMVHLHDLMKAGAT